MASVRKAIESNVLAYHSRINENDEAPKTRALTKAQLETEWNRKISEMDIIELIRFAHPEDRGNFARKALEEGLITKDQAREFVKFV